MPSSFKDLYLSAFALYKQGFYDKATPIFKELCIKSPLQEDFWRGLASSLQMQHSLEEAILAWGVSASLKQEDPIPPFHSAECFHLLGLKEEALKLLSQAEKKIHAESEHRDLLPNIHLLKELLS